MSSLKMPLVWPSSLAVLFNMPSSSPFTMVKWIKTTVPALIVSTGNPE